MEKSTERLTTETQISQAHTESLKIGTAIVQAEYNGDFDKAFNDPIFIYRVQEEVSTKWNEYLAANLKLAQLEIDEDYPATHSYLESLERISSLLPKENLKNAYYPYSGLDLYWASQFDSIVFQDIGFDGIKTPEVWWGLESYSTDNRQAILDLTARLTSKKLANSEFIGGDIEASGAFDFFNTPDVTLIIKGGHDFLGDIKDKKLKFGAIIAGDLFNSPSEIIAELSKFGYSEITPLEGINGSNWNAPFTLPMTKIHIYRLN